MLETGENSPCSVAWWWNRDKILPAREKWPDFGVFGRAGRVLYRLGPGVAVAGRVMYRMGLEVGVAGRVLYRLSPGMGVAGRVLYRMGQGVGVAGRVLYRLSPGVAVAGRVLYRVSGGLVLEAGESSPCSVAWWWNREKILPARLKWPDFVDCGRAGRVLYRLGQRVGVAGRVLYRLSPGVAVAGRVLYRVSGGLVLEAGENSPCSREMAGFRCFWACRESFVPVGPVRGARWGRVCCVEPH